MSAPKHTAAPWLVFACADGETYSIVDSRDLQELSTIATVHFHDDHEGETLANARVMAAAPMLLERARIALDYLTQSKGPDVHLAESQLRAAIAEALGVKL